MGVVQLDPSVKSVAFPVSIQEEGWRRALWCTRWLESAAETARMDREGCLKTNWTPKHWDWPRVCSIDRYPAPSTATQRQHTNCVPAVLFWPRLLGQSSKLTFLVYLVQINWGAKLSLAESLKSEALRAHFEKNHPLQKFGYIWGVKRLVCNPKNMLKLKFQSKNVRGQTSSSRGSFLTYIVGVSDQNCNLQTTIGS